ncbi:hypothetical protein [Mycolicibacterium sp. HK-90]|uniref:hypothetical protein n=1 Tax=Mycolicibacterium sp. HK-90 TaxID=3056937 RepID=UPI00265AF61F|nr:hypothetical protein [Mycolicibacterium sp. HK-90]WKG02162.1 hypothetical protein QU592_23485 [Mycolicibacterium sp. HK-90]
MSGRHKMPPAGRRKAAADPVEGAERTAPAEVTEGISEEPTAQESGPENPTPEEAVTAETPADTEVKDLVADTEPAEDTEEPAEDTEEPPAAAEPAEAQPPVRTGSRVSLPAVLATVALVLAVAAAVLRWQIVSSEASDTARAESVEAARDITVQMLSYETETVAEQLNAVRERLTGNFLGSYTAMINDIIPAAQAQQIAAVADVPEIAVVSAEPNSAELVLYVNQAVQVGGQMPQRTPSVARATMVKEGDRWLMSEYEPVPL